MTMPVALEPCRQISRRRRAAARLAVAASVMLARLSPRRLRLVLSAVRHGAEPATAAQAFDAREAVVSVSILCAGQGCLPRAIATALLCRLGGTWPTWCAGVRTEPFRAHAWVEVDGGPIGEREDIHSYHKIMTVPAIGMSNDPGREK